MQAFTRLTKQGRLGVPHALADRARVFERGEPAQHAWFLEHGAVEIVQGGGADGVEVVVKILVAPTLFGVIEQLGDEASYLESVRCLGGVRAHRVERADFLRLLREDNALLFECTTDMGRAFCASARFEPSRMYEADVLLANLLVAYAEIFGAVADGGVQLRIQRTQNELAQTIGASERQVNRLIKDWRAAMVSAW